MVGIEFVLFVVQKHILRLARQQVVGRIVVLTAHTHDGRPHADAHQQVAVAKLSADFTVAVGVEHTVAIDIAVGRQLAEILSVG